MSHIRSMYNDSKDKLKLITRRAMLLYTGESILGGILLFRYFKLQVIDGKKYKRLADANRIKVVVIPSIRGNILDTHGNIIAKDREEYNLITTEDLTYDELIELEDILAKNALQHKQGNQNILLNNLDSEEAFSIASVFYDNEKLKIASKIVRYYPYDNLFSHVLGYTRRIKKSRYLQIFKGVYGIERIYNEALEGIYGYRKFESDAFGHTVRVIEEIKPEKGKELQLTLDSSIQTKIQEIMDDTVGAMIILDMKGKLQAMYSNPSYNNNDFTHGMSHEKWQDLKNDIRNPMVNRAISSYPLGSVFKPIVSLTALEKGFDPNTVFYCDGGHYIGNRRFRCWKSGGHGDLNMHDALVQSCNVYFYKLAELLNSEDIITSASLLGMGENTGIELENESKGILPHKEWLRNNVFRPWQQGDVTNLVIGQGYINATPLQLGLALLRLITNEKYRVSMIKEDNNSMVEKLPFSQKNIDFVKYSMRDVINTRLGTGYRGRISHFEMAGKTGTAQKSKKSLGLKNGNYIAFAPYDSPKYVVATLVDRNNNPTRAALMLTSRLLSSIL